MGFLSSEDVTNAQDEAPTPVKPRPSVGRSSLTAEHEPRAAAADVRRNTMVPGDMNTYEVAKRT